MGSLNTWGASIVVAEDDLLIGELVMLHLKAAGHHAVWVKSGVEVIGRLAELKPQLLVLDIGLPQVNGFDILAEIRRSRQYDPLRVLVLTARQTPGDVKRALALGATDYVAKPFEVGQLVRRIQKHLTSMAPTPKIEPPRPAQTRDDSLLL